MKQVLRKVEQRDLNSILLWRNHPEVNKFMFSQHLITQEEHDLWFKNNLNNPLKQMFVYEENNVLRGFIQIHKKSESSGVYEWGFYISPDAIKGVGTRMCTSILDEMFKNLDATKVYGEVLAFNEPSINLHKKLKFTLEGKLRKHHLLNNVYHDILCFGLLKSEWVGFIG